MTSEAHRRYQVAFDLYTNLQEIRVAGTTAQEAYLSWVEQPTRDAELVASFAVLMAWASATFAYDHQETGSTEAMRLSNGLGYIATEALKDAAALGVRSNDVRHRLPGGWSDTADRVMTA